MFSDNSTDWYSLGSVSYRKWTFYDMIWQKKNVNLNQFQVRGSPLGGPIALYDDDKKLNNKIKFSIYSSSGAFMTDIEYEFTSRVVSFGWSDLEQLIIVHENGS